MSLRFWPWAELIKLLTLMCESAGISCGEVAPLAVMTGVAALLFSLKNVKLNWSRSLAAEA